MKGVISWGTTAWALLDAKVTIYESNLDSKAFFIQRGYIHRSFLLPFAGQESEGERNPQWELLCGITLWVIWKSRCIRVFSGKKVPPVEGIKEIWAEAVHSLKGQYDSIRGDSETAIRMRQTFLRTWVNTPFIVYVGLSLCWNFCTPTWLYSPRESCHGYQ